MRGKRPHVARIPRPHRAFGRIICAWVGQQLLGWSLRGRWHSPLLQRPNVARILRPTRAKGEDNPRLGGAAVVGVEFKREAILPVTPTPQRSAYSAPYPRFWGGQPALGWGSIYEGGSTPATPTPSRGAYFRKEALSRGAYSAPYPRCEGAAGIGEAVFREKDSPKWRVLRPQPAHLGG